MAIELNDCHVKIYKAIKSFCEKYGYSPSIREIQKTCGYKSPSTVYAHLKTLERAGYIQVGHRRRPRAIKVV
ncbi:LexA family protein [Maledivibacter halophilus]|uniref:SOS-response transcriptional repressors (RecA-mediated autopeptidases) n=1 Tax=Maledivibacter halophilus TaxID=36842 RepID=A0A1T5MRL7_9FIRM|nr:helix-turn-helix domain-containing protein [Maledivibacter halophilus]SKC90548.1 SOS-response transcriptional repressors (RecA-mediated autopeptidases) [Maledivibacter halophilus]